MSEVIYSASLLQVFMWSFVTIAFVSILEVVGIGMGIFRRNREDLCAPCERLRGHFSPSYWNRIGFRGVQITDRQLTDLHRSTE